MVNMIWLTALSTCVWCLISLQRLLRNSWLFVSLPLVRKYEVFSIGASIFKWNCDSLLFL